MNAVISGRAGFALLIEGESLMSLDVDDLETLVPTRSSDLRFLLADATDLITLENTGHEEIAQRLDLEHDIACALDMTLIALDADSSMELRAEAVAALDELLTDARVIERLEFTMYAKPLPESANLKGAELCAEVNSAAAESFFERLSQYQNAVSAVRDSWNTLPDRLFGDEAAAKAVFHSLAWDEGLFRLLALSYGDQAKVSSFLIEALKNKSISSLPNYRDIVQRWCAPIRAAIGTSTAVAERQHDADDEESIETPHRSTGRDKWRRRREPAYVVLRKVESQKELIVAAMRERDITRARQVLDELVDFHLKTGRPEHLAMTLCALAMEAKALGDIALQLELTKKAVEAKPDDAWSWVQQADALLNIGRLNEALGAYRQADAFGGGAVAKTGLAEVMKAQGRLLEAEAAFDEAIATHPENVVAKIGRAEVLKAQGRLLEAGAAFDEMIAAHPENVVAQTGRAEVLKAQGQLVEAEAAFDEILATHPQNVAARTGLAEVLISERKLPEALRAFEEIIAVHPEHIGARASRAQILKAQGNLAEALSAYEELIADRPEDELAGTGRAEVFEAQGRFRAALRAYDAMLTVHPQWLIAQNGRSRTLAALGRYEEALAHLPVDTPQTEHDWIGLHIRGMTFLRMGDILGADQIFELGEASCPWRAHAEIFTASRALARIHEGQFGAAEAILDQVTSRELNAAREMLDQMVVPAFKPHAQVLRLHALGELNEIDRAFAVYADLKANPRPFSDDLPDELYHRYIVREGSLHDDAWVDTREVDIFLLTA